LFDAVALVATAQNGGEIESDGDSISVFDRRIGNPKAFPFKGKVPPKGADEVVPLG